MSETGTAMEIHPYLGFHCSDFNQGHNRLLKCPLREQSVGVNKIQYAILTKLMECPYYLSHIAMAPKHKTVMLSSRFSLLSQDVGEQYEE